MRKALLGAAAALVFGGAALAAAPATVTRTDNYVGVDSTAPGMAGKPARIYVREVSVRRGGPSKGVVLFIHGAGTPAEVAFDVPYGDYSWMAYLARDGFDVFSMDMEGYGRSTRPPPMADACNTPAAAQAQFVPKPLAAPCPASFKGPITHMGSDWNDIAAVVDHLLKMKGVKQVSLVAWSQGGPRSGGFAIAHPDKVKAIVALAPAYIRDMPTREPSPLPAVASPVTTQSQAEFKAGWDRQATCPGQYEPAVAASVWSEMLKSDPEGAAWGPGVRRAPSVPSWGFNKETVPNLTVPYLMVAGATDRQVDPSLVHNLYADIGSKQKILIDLACASHNAMWEKQHLALFKASAEFLSTGKVNGVSSGEMKLGD